MCVRMVLIQTGQLPSHGSENGDHARRRPVDGDQAGRRQRLGTVLSVMEILTLASSWIAFWLTVEVVPADVRISEANPVVDALLAWSAVGVALFSLAGFVATFGLFRVAKRYVTNRLSVVVLSIGAGTVAGLSLLDVVWNLVLLVELDAVGAIGAPGPAAILFAAGVVAYLCLVHCLSRRPI